jgi:hypothetical protein
MEALVGIPGKMAIEALTDPSTSGRAVNENLAGWCGPPPKARTRPGRLSLRDRSTPNPVASVRDLEGQGPGKPLIGLGRAPMSAGAGKPQARQGAEAPASIQAKKSISERST